MMTPIVNVNGTVRDELVSQRLAVATSLSDVLDKLNLAAPHGRDYPGDMEMYRRDRGIHDSRAKLISDLYHEIMNEAMSIIEW